MINKIKIKWFLFSQITEEDEYSDFPSSQMIDLYQKKFLEINNYEETMQYLRNNIFKNESLSESFRYLSGKKSSRKYVGERLEGVIMIENINRRSLSSLDISLTYDKKEENEVKKSVKSITKFKM